MFGAWLWLPIWALKLWLLVVGLVAFLSAPVECFHAIIKVISRLFKRIYVLATKHYYFKAVAAFYGIEL